MRRVFLLLVTVVMILGFSVVVQASNLTVIGEGTIGSSANNGTENMVNGGYQLIYDSAQNITWLDYTAAEATWQNQVNWADNLEVSFDGTTLKGWSLPTTVDNNSSEGNHGWNPPSNSSEMAYLYYVDLGNIGYPNSGYGLKNVGPFENLSTDNVYWSGTAYSASSAWLFVTTFGTQGPGPTASNDVYGLAVLPGEPAAQSAPVPEPSTIILVGAGLAGLAGWRKAARRRG